MPPPWPSRPADALRLAAFALAAFAAPAHATGSERLVLAVSVNGGAPAPEPVLVRREGAGLWMRAADLRALGILVRGDAAEVALRDVAGLTFALDEAGQAIALAQAPRFRPRAAGPALADDAPPPTPNGWGATINYDVAATRAGGRTAVAGLLDGILFLPAGYAYAGAIVAAGPGTGPRRVTRLDTGLTGGDPARARR